MASNFGQQIQSCADGQRDVDEVSAAQGGTERSGEYFVDRAGFAGVHRNLATIPTGDMNIRRVFAERLGERTADQAGSEDAGALNEMRHN